MSVALLAAMPVPVAAKALAMRVAVLPLTGAALRSPAPNLG